MLFFHAVQATLTDAEGKNVLAKMALKLTTGSSIADLESAVASAEAGAQASAAKAAEASAEDR